MKIYAQIVNGKVNLIGGAEVGLPFYDPSRNVISRDITDLSNPPQEGWFYDSSTDTFSPNGIPPSSPPSLEDRVEAIEAVLKLMI